MNSLTRSEKVVYSFVLIVGIMLAIYALQAVNASADDKPATTTTAAGGAKPDSDVEATKPDFTAAFWRCHDDWRVTPEEVYEEAMEAGDPPLVIAAKRAGCNAGQEEAGWVR
jgi:hypothetical protein